MQKCETRVVAAMAVTMGLLWGGGSIRALRSDRHQFEVSAQPLGKR